MNGFKIYASDHYNEALDILRRLCVIPAPSHHEEQRALFCRDYLLSLGAENVYIDDKLNVIYPVNCDGSNEITVFAAHTDTVFPDTAPYPMSEDDEKIYCPGVGDDTASVTVLLLLAKYFIENRIMPDKGVLFVMNSCEEGLGNLEGTKALMKAYSGRIKRFITFDSADPNELCDKCVGSHRYEVEVRTQGGHSFSCFGRKNAIRELSQIVTEIYNIQVPQIESSKTTYNVGIIEGGTSVNTIAQNAKMLCEYRSDNRECLAYMKERFSEIFEKAANDEVKVNVKLVGERPCMGDVDPILQKKLCDTCADTITNINGKDVQRKIASTDCNIPLSLGIPSVCIGVFRGGGAHTREEYVIKSSLSEGLEIALNVSSCLLKSDGLIFT